VDLITQGIIGAAAAQCGARPDRLRIAALAGGVAGVLPDLDVLIRSPSDPLLFLEYHRHFTHALAFIPLGAIIAAMLTRLLMRKRETLRALLWPSLLGISTHGLLDACTSYGTHLFWPFSDGRVAWHIIAIVDPLFTLTLLVGVVLATWRGWRRAARTTAGLALAYLGLCIVQQGRAQVVHADLMEQRGHASASVQVKPAIGSNILYRAFYTHNDTYFVDAIRVPWLGAPRTYEGSTTPVLDLDGYMHRYALDSLRRADIARFSLFSDGYLIEDPRACGMLSDFRYAAVPNAVEPLWSIDVLGSPSGEHLDFHRWRALDKEGRQTFVDMLLGR
jgi:inner membrane protein